jgi:phage gpG-like protein
MGNLIKAINFGYARENLLRDTARMAASESVRFFKESFVKGGFTGASLQKWPDRESPLGGKKLMYGTGTLMQSIHTTEESAKRISVVSDTAYSEIHNNGGVITVTARMKRYWWAQYYRFSGTAKRNSNTKAGRSFNTRLNARTEFCKRMALMKVGSKVKIPQRQFMGESQALMNILDKELQAKIAEYWENA